MKSARHFAGPREPYSPNPDDPILALPFLFRYDKESAFSEAEVLHAAACHMHAIMSNDRVQNPDHLWGERWKTWEKQQFRKLAKRTTPSKFDALVNSKSPNLIISKTTVSEGRQIQFLSVPPYAVNNPDIRVAKFPVSGLQLPEGSLLSEPTEGKKQLLLSINKDLNASTGKLIAQVAHGVQLGIYNSTVDEVNEWEENGADILFVEPGTRTPFAKVQDAGFTEIPAGSETISIAWSE